jgi:outer membrane protein
MKNSANILSKLALGLAIAGSVAACTQKADNKAATPVASTDKVTTVFINQDTLLNKYEYFKDMSKRLEDKGKAADADLNNRGQAIQREVAEYQKNAATMTAEQRAATEQRLQRKGQEFQAYRQNAGAQVQNDQVTEQGKLYDKVADFLKGYAKEKGYKLILTYKRGEATVMYGDPSLDVTADVVKRMNEAYAKDKK